ncbi:hypothetical protein Taro_044861, partial [Colocasia esculenta]|nr:hypothetical protein [Colocasia esculenta]
MIHRGTMDIIQVMVLMEVANMRQECMGGLNDELEFQFQPLLVSSSYGSTSYSCARGSFSYSDYGFHSTQEPFIPREIQRGMNYLAASLFGYSEYAKYVHPFYGYQWQAYYEEKVWHAHAKIHLEDERDGSKERKRKKIPRSNSGTTEKTREYEEEEGRTGWATTLGIPAEEKTWRLLSKAFFKSSFPSPK